MNASNWGCWWSISNGTAWCVFRRAKLVEKLGHIRRNVNYDYVVVRKRTRRVLELTIRWSAVFEIQIVHQEDLLRGRLLDRSGYDAPCDTSHGYL